LLDADKCTHACTFTVLLPIKRAARCFNTVLSVHTRFNAWKWRQLAYRTYVAASLP